MILTGTPEGVGFTREPPLFLQPGDEVEVEVEGVGVLTNTVVAEAEGEAAPAQVWSHAQEKMIDP